MDQTTTPAGGLWGGVTFPANAEIESKIAANAVVVLEIEVEFLKSRSSEGSVPALCVVGGGS